MVSQFAAPVRIPGVKLFTVENAVNNLLADGVRLREALQELRATPEPNKHQLLYVASMLQAWDLALKNGNTDVEELRETIDDELEGRDVRPIWNYQAIAGEVA